MNLALVFPRSWGPVGGLPALGRRAHLACGACESLVPKEGEGPVGSPGPSRESGRPPHSLQAGGWAVVVGTDAGCGRMRGVGRAALEARPQPPGFTGLPLGPTVPLPTQAASLLPTRITLERREHASSRGWRCSSGEGRGGGRAVAGGPPPSLQKRRRTTWTPNQLRGDKVESCETFVNEGGWVGGKTNGTQAGASLGASCWGARSAPHRGRDATLSTRGPSASLCCAWLTIPHTAPAHQRMASAQSQPLSSQAQGHPYCHPSWPLWGHPGTPPCLPSPAQQGSEAKCTLWQRSGEGSPYTDDWRQALGG